MCVGRPFQVNPLYQKSDSDSDADDDDEGESDKGEETEEEDSATGKDTGNGEDKSDDDTVMKSKGQHDDLGSKEEMDVDAILASATKAEKNELVKVLLNHRKSKKYRIRKKGRVKGIREIQKKAFAKLGNPTRVKFITNQFQNFVRVEIFKDAKFPVNDKKARRLCKRAAKTLKHENEKDFVEAFSLTLNLEINKLRSQTQTLIRMNVRSK